MELAILSLCISLASLAFTTYVFVDALRAKRARSRWTVRIEKPIVATDFETLFAPPKRVAGGKS